MISEYHAKYFAYELTRQKSGGDVDRISSSLFDAAVDLNPHQIDAALFALQNPLSKGVLLADEVGLGKTIEAALVLCQYWAEFITQIYPKNWFCLRQKHCFAKVYANNTRSASDTSVPVRVFYIEKGIVKL